LNADSILYECITSLAKSSSEEATSPYIESWRLADRHSRAPKFRAV
jgi:hypothetical protein